MALFTATSYANNTEVRAAYPSVDTLLPQVALTATNSGVVSSSVSSTTATSSMLVVTTTSFSGVSGTSSVTVASTTVIPFTTASVVVSSVSVPGVGVTVTRTTQTEIPGSTTVASTTVGAVLTAITVPTTNGFPYAGEIALLDSSNTLQQMSYSKKDETHFYIDASQSGSVRFYSTGTTVSSSEYLLNRYRAMAYSVVVARLNNADVSTDLKKTLEIMWVFYLVTKQHPDKDVREWGKTVKEEFFAEIQNIQSQFPGKIKQTICKLVEEDLSDDDIYALKYGPSGNQ